MSDFPATYFSDDEHENRLRMYEQYLPVLKAKILLGKFRMQEDAADDLIHDFYLQKVQPSSPNAVPIFARWDPERGVRFRSFILAVFINFAKSRLARSNNQLTNLTDQDLNVLDRPCDDNVHDRVLLEWAVTVTLRILTRFREEGPSEWFQAYVMYNGLSGAPASYEEIRQRLDKQTVNQIAGILQRARQRYDAIQTEVVRELSARSTEEELADEIAEFTAIKNRRCLSKQLLERVQAEFEPAPPIERSDTLVSHMNAADFGVLTTEDQLRLLMRADFQDWSFDPQRHVYAESQAEPGAPTCLADLVRTSRRESERRPSTRLIQAIKSLGKRGLSNTLQGLSAGSAKVLYCTAIACGIVHYGLANKNRFSRLPQEEIVKNIEMILSECRLPQEIEGILKEARDSLQQS